MLLTVPSSIAHHDASHHKMPILTLDVDAEGKRLATGGLDQKVKLWSISAITAEFSPEAQEGAIKERHVCTLTHQTGAVMCVKFSHSPDHWLATGGDDHTILVYALDQTQNATTAFGEADQNVENWRLMRTLTGHTSDVTSVVWTRGNKHLLSAALDGEIHVWECQAGVFTRLKTLRQHAGFVKGLSLDPTGQYLASQSDDRTLKIWRTRDWQLEHDVTRPFGESHGHTFFSRPSWSPDAMHLAATNASDSSQSFPISSILRRDTWKEQVALVGHTGSIECAAFSPKLFRKRGRQGNAPHAIVALGSQDCSLSIWDTSRATPLAVVTGVADRAILDICWHPDGVTFFAASYNGTLIACRFEQNELGEALSDKACQLLMSQQTHKEAAQQRSMDELPQSAPLAAKMVSARQMTGDRESPQKDKVTEPAVPASRSYSQPEGGPRRIAPQLMSSGNAAVASGAPPAIDAVLSMAHGQAKGQSSSDRISFMREGQPSAFPTSFPAPTARLSVPTRALITGGQLCAVQIGTPPIAPRGVHRIDEDLNCEFTNQDGLGIVFVSSGDENVVWQDSFASAVSLIVSTRDKLVIATEDAHVHLVESASGRRLLPPLLVNAAVSLMTLNQESDHLLVITSAGFAHVWHLPTATNCIADLSLQPLLVRPLSKAEQRAQQQGGHPIRSGDRTGESPTRQQSEVKKTVRHRCIRKAAVRQNGALLITLDDDDVYIYDPKQWAAWLKLSSGALAEAALGLDDVCDDDAQLWEPPRGTLSVLQKRPKMKKTKFGDVESFERLLDRELEAAAAKQAQQKTAVLQAFTHLSIIEQHLHAAELLQSQHEAHLWHLIYARRITSIVQFMLEQNWKDKAVHQMMGSIEGRLTSWAAHLMQDANKSACRETFEACCTILANVPRLHTILQSIRGRYMEESSANL